MDLTDIQTIKKLIKDNHIHPDNKSGQNFLVDKKVLDDIMAAADIKASDTILEIGPGFGVLTEQLLSRAKRVVAVEKDRALIRYLRTQLGLKTQLNIVNADILQLDPVSLGFQTQAYRIVANIPYNITGKIIKKFVSDTSFKPKDMLMLVQKEVGERICATPGKMGLLAIAVQLYAEPSIVLPVSRRAFWPEPKVDSVLLKIANIKSKSSYPIQDERAFWRLLHIGFSSPRKQLHNNLAAGLGISPEAVKIVFNKLKIAEKARAQELSIEQWIKLSQELPK